MISLVSFSKIGKSLVLFIKLTSYELLDLFVIITFVYIYYNQIKPLGVNSYRPNKEYVEHIDKYDKQVDLYYV